MEAYGAPASITSCGADRFSFNLDGSTLYQSIAAIFSAQLYGIDLSIWRCLVLTGGDLERDRRRARRLLRGAAATLGGVGIAGRACLCAGVDRILDMARTALNVVGNALAVLVIAKWEHKFGIKAGYEREVLGKFDKPPNKTQSPAR